MNRKVGETICITAPGQQEVLVTVRRIVGDRVELAVVLPKTMPIDRKEVWEVLQREEAHRRR